ncbi:hypothetical protein ON010_g11442 [Phytophthora cinnamomi]|nr:hypothetical protein ON010_g11442 [Phytophthora cinnamomi]
MWLLRASAMVNVNFSERFDAPHIVADIFSGVILIVCIVFSFLALMSFADFLRFHLDHIEEEMVAEEEAPHRQHHHHHHHHRHQPVRRAQFGEGNHPDEAANLDDQDAEPRLRPMLDGPRRLGNLDENADSDDDSSDEEWVNQLNRDEPFADAFIQHQEFGVPLVEDADPVPEPQHELRQRRPLRDAPEIAEERGRNAAAAAPRAARNRVDPPPPNMNQREWEDDFEHMEINIAMDELLGLRGDFMVLFRNVSWLLAFNGAYLGAVTRCLSCENVVAVGRNGEAKWRLLAAGRSVHLRDGLLVDLLDDRALEVYGEDGFFVHPPTAHGWPTLGFTLPDGDCEGVDAAAAEDGDPAHYPGQGDSATGRSPGPAAHAANPEIQVPLELLVVHLVVLSVLEHAKNDIGKFQHLAIVFASERLGLTEFLLPQTELEVVVNGHHKSKVVVLPPPPLHFHPRAQLPPEELRVDGHRYLPWPEEGLDDPQPVEYPLLPRERPSHLLVRLAGLALFSWAVCIVVIGTFLFGSLFIGRMCMAPFERVSGISHDPLVMAAGVQIVWYFVNGVHALNILLLPEDRVDPTLVQRGYSVRNMTPANAVVCVLGWAFVCPFLLGQLMSSCVASAKASSLESFLMGYLMFNLFAWLVCCFRAKRNNRRRNQRQAALEELEADEDGFLDVEEDDELFEDDLNDDELEEEERLLQEEGVAAAADAEPVGFIACFRKAYRQLQFNVTVHENEAVRLRRDNIREKCFDVAFFQENVLQPIAVFLLGMLVVPWLLSSVVLLVFSSEKANFEKTALDSTVFGEVGSQVGRGCHSWSSHRTTMVNMRCTLEKLKLPTGLHSERIQWLYEGAKARSTDDSYLLYWMQTSVRTKHNYALEYAVAAANKLKLPLHVVYLFPDRSVVPPLQPDADDEWKGEAVQDANAHGFVTERHALFALEGLADARQAQEEVPERPESPRPRRAHAGRQLR